MSVAFPHDDGSHANRAPNEARNEAPIAAPNEAPKEAPKEAHEKGAPEKGSPEKGSPEKGSDGEGLPASGAVDEHIAYGAVRHLHNEKLFGRGEPRTCLYYIEKGVVALCRRANGRQEDIVEFAFAGDVVGYGLFENHTSCAQAIGEVHVRSLPLAALDAILRNDKRAFDRCADTLERDFQDRRNELIRAERKLVHRVAALLLALSRQNTVEGRDPRLVTDELECGAAANWLRIDIGELMDALRELEQSRLIERCPPNGLRLSDVAGLARLADEFTARASPALGQSQDWSIEALRAAVPACPSSWLNGPQG